MPFLQVADLDVHYLHRRPASSPSPPVVLIHGAGGTHQHWLYQVRDLPASTYAVDLPGHGRSEGMGRDRIEGYAEWLVAFLDAAGLNQAILVGHSMGGAIALATALGWPQRVSGLGLVATGARLRVAPPIFAALEEDFQAAIALIGEWTYGPDTPAETVRMGRQQMGATPPRVLRNDFLACDTFNVMDRLGEIRCPAAVLCGTQDRLTPVKYATFLSDRIARARLHLVQGAGHMVMMEKPPEVARALQELVEESDSTT